MTMHVPPDAISDIEEEDTRITHVSTGAMGAIVKSEVEAQLEAAHRFPRSVTRFLKESVDLATITVEVAESCIYALKRREASGEEKFITGPSVRLAELMASAWGNLHVGARVVDEDEKTITAQGGAWDLQKNLRVTVENRRRITGRNGRRYSDDMVVVTGNAAASIALRNAIFRVIPRSYVSKVFDRVRAVAVGDAKTLTARRSELLDRLSKIGVSLDRVLAKLGKVGVADIGLDDIEVLIGLGTSLKTGEASIDDVFPAPAAPAPAAPAEDGKRISPLKSTKPKDEAPEPGSNG